MIDDHVHPFPLEFAAFRPEGIALDVAGGQVATQRRRDLAPGRLYLHLMQTMLSRLLGVELADVVAARDERARSDWTGWLRRLFDDADITGMILDAAVGPGEAAQPAAAYAEAAGRPVWQMARIDPVVDHLIEAGATAAEVVQAVETFMAEAAAAGAVAFKTILAYRTGLAVDPGVDLAAAQRSLGEDLPLRRRAKPLRDLVLRTALGRAADLGRPVQFHTGFGDSELRLAQSDPLLLEEVLRTPEGGAADVVLIHGSFPWHEPAAYLAASRPNVWLELSLSNLFAPVGTADRLLRMLDVAPRGRLLLGSDGHGVPETHWFGCRVLHHAWQKVAATLIAEGANADWVEDTRTALFDGTARAVYSLPV